MAMFGMDIDEVRQLSQQLQQASSDIHNIVSQLTSKLSGTTWVGPDRQKFESDWQSHHVTALNNVSTALHDASSLATQNAQQQQDASS
jgi:uncharacterized protein YukE